MDAQKQYQALTEEFQKLQTGKVPLEFYYALQNMVANYLARARWPR